MQNLPEVIEKLKQAGYVIAPANLMSTNHGCYNLYVIHASGDSTFLEEFQGTPDLQTAAREALYGNGITKASGLAAIPRYEMICWHENKIDILARINRFMARHPEPF